MSSHYSEELQVERLKQWWEKYGGSVVIGVILGLGLIGGNKYWAHYSQQQGHAASTMYQQFMSEIGQQQLEQAKTTANQIKANYSSTPYAGFSALALAKLAYYNGAKDEAAKQLQWAVENAATEALEQTARLRLARVLYEQGQLDHGLQWLGDNSAPGFEAEYYELKGDLLLRKQDIEGARAAYQSALKNLAPGSSYQETLQLKLDNLGAATA